MQYKLPSNKFLGKALIIFCGITLAVLFFLAQRTPAINSRNTGILRPHSRRLEATKQSNSFNSVPNKEEVDKERRPGKKIFIAFSYWEQLAQATQNFLDLTALAAYNGRQVVVPFVKNSQFYGSPAKGRFELSLYYNVTALNRTLHSRGHGTLISWKEFQDNCQGKLDVLVYFDYTNPSQATQAASPCKDRSWITIKGFRVSEIICMNVFAVNSIEKFEKDVVKRLPCVGLAEWRGSNDKNEKDQHRAKFNLSSVVTDRMCYRDAYIFFSSKLLHLAQTFIEKNLGPLFVSAHIRTEMIFAQLGTSLNISIATVEKCVSNLVTQVQRHKKFSTARIPVFLATDFTDFGSKSLTVKPVRQNAKLLMKILAPLNPVMFQPSAYNLTDKGAVALVEMNILASGEHLFVVGGGHFQDLVVNHFFINKNNTEQRLARPLPPALQRSSVKEITSQTALLEKICKLAVIHS